MSGMARLSKDPDRDRRRKAQGRIYAALRNRIVLGDGTKLTRRKLAEELEMDEWRTIEYVEQGRQPMPKDDLLRDEWERTIAYGEALTGPRRARPAVPLRYAVGLAEPIGLPRRIEFPDPIRIFGDRAKAKAAARLLDTFGVIAIGIVPIYSHDDPLDREFDETAAWLAIVYSWARARAVESDS